MFTTEAPLRRLFKLLSCSILSQEKTIKTVRGLQKGRPGDWSTAAITQDCQGLAYVT